MSLFTTENEEVAFKVCPNKIQVNTSDKKLHYVCYKIFFLSSQDRKNESSWKKKKIQIDMQHAKATV